MQTLRRRPAALGALGTAPLLALVITLGTPAVAPAQPVVQILAYSFVAPNPFLTITVAIPKDIDTAARTGTADWGLRLTVIYVDVNGQVDTLDSGRLSIKNDTLLGGPIDNNTVAISLQLPIPVQPGATPSYVGTAQLLPPPVIPFALLSATLAINNSKKQFAEGGQFTLGAGGTCCSTNPLADVVTLQIGGFSITIPANSFKKDAYGNYVYFGTINGVQLAAAIRPQSGTPNTFRYGVGGQGATTLPTCATSSCSVTVGLTVGNNTGSTSVNAFFQIGGD
jgi:hypothetical protein